MGYMTKITVFIKRISQLFKTISYNTHRNFSSQGNKEDLMQLPKKRSAEDEIEKVDDFLYNDSTFEVSKKRWKKINGTCLYFLFAFLNYTNFINYLDKRKQMLKSILTLLNQF